MVNLADSTSWNQSKKIKLQHFCSVSQSKFRKITFIFGSTQIYTTSLICKNPSMSAHKFLLGGWIKELEMGRINTGYPRPCCVLPCLRRKVHAMNNHLLDFKSNLSVFPCSPYPIFNPVYKKHQQAATIDQTRVPRLWEQIIVPLCNVISVSFSEIHYRWLWIDVGWNIIIW